MQPKPLPAAQIGEAIERVNSTAIDTSGGRNNEGWPSAASAVGSDRPRHRVDAQTEIIVALQNTDVRCRETDRDKRSFDRCMRLIRQIRDPGSTLLPCDGESD
jgi:hypothetical protein